MIKLSSSGLEEKQNACEFYLQNGFVLILKEAELGMEKSFRVGCVCDLGRKGKHLKPPKRSQK